MVTTLKKRNSGVYYCNNCMMNQPADLRANCYFCGSWFSNITDILIQEEEEQERNKIKENKFNAKKN